MIGYSIHGTQLNGTNVRANGRRGSAERERDSGSISALLQPDLNDLPRHSAGRKHSANAPSQNPIQNHINGSHALTYSTHTPHPPSGHRRPVPPSQPSGMGNAFQPDRRASAAAGSAGDQTATPPLGPQPVHQGAVVPASAHAAIGGGGAGNNSYDRELHSRRTPEPRGAIKLPAGALFAPPSAPAAPRDKSNGRTRAMLAGGAIPYPAQGMFVASQLGNGSHNQMMPPPHPQSAMPASHREQVGSAMHNNHQQHNQPPPSVARGSLQSTIASARKSTTYGRLTVQQPPSSQLGRFATNSPSPNSTPVKPAAARFQDFSSPSQNNSPMASPRQNESVQQNQPAQRKRGVLGLNQQQHAPIPIALSWPGDFSHGPSSASNNNAAAAAPHPRGFPSRGGVRASYPSASPPPPPERQHSTAAGFYGHHTQNQSHLLHHPHGHQAASLPNFPSIVKRGAQLIEALPVTLSPPFGTSANDDSHDGVDNEDYEDVALVDLADEETPPRQKKRVGSGATANRQKPSVAAIKKLDLSTAQAFRTPYNRKSFANAAPNASNNPTSGSTTTTTKSRKEVPLAHEWNNAESEDELDGGTGEESKQPYSSDGPSSNPPLFLSVGVAEDANPRFRASMEDAHVVRRSFGPAIGGGGANNVSNGSGKGEKRSDESENKELDPSGSPSAVSSPSSSVPSQRGAFFAVYDGHGGRNVVDFVAKQFHRELSRKLSTPSRQQDVPKAIEQAAARIDAAMAPGSHGIGEEFQECGSTACFAYLRPCLPDGSRGREIFLGNIGDAQAVLAIDKSWKPGDKGVGKKKKKGNGTASTATNGSSDRPSSPNTASSETQRSTPSKAPRQSTSGSVTQRVEPAFAKTIARQSAKKKLSALSLSYPHVATDAKEMQRINKAGGCVFANRVNGCLAVSRAFGDHALKSSGVSCLPYQQHVELTPAHKFLIIGCDGIFDVMDGKQAVDAVADMMNGPGGAQAMAQKLVDLAIKKGTTDNVSCMVIILNQ